MAIDIKTAIWTAVIHYYDKVTLASGTLKVANGAGFTVGGVSALSAGYLMVLSQPIAAKRSAFGGARTGGQGATTFGSVVLTNALGVLDGYRNYAFDGREIEFRIVAPGGDLATAGEAAGSYTMETPVVGRGTFTIPLRDWQRALEVPIQTTLFAGDNVPPDGIEGTADLAGKPLPLVLGAPRHTPFTLVNAQKQIYRVHEGALAGISAVYDRGIPLTSGAVAWGAVTSGFGGGDVIRGVDSDDSGIVLLIGDGGKIARSTDYGATFALITSPVATQLNAVHWCRFLQLWIIGGAGAVLYTSPTGTTGSWTSRTSTFTASSVNAITSSDTTVIIAGDDGKAASSTNGTSYTARTSGFSTSHIWGAAHRYTTGATGVFVIVGQVGQVATSPDGITWTLQFSLPAGEPLRSVAGGQNGFVIVGDAGGSGSMILHTEIGVAFTRIAETAFEGADIRAIAVNPSNLFVAVDDVGKIGTSNDNGQTWTIRTTTAGAQSYYAVAFAGTTWIATSSGGLVDRAALAVTYASLTDLEDDTLAPQPSSYGVYLAGGLVRLGRAPIGRVTGVVTEGATAADRTAAQLAIKVMRRAGFGTPNLVLQSEDFSTTWSAVGTPTRVDGAAAGIAIDLIGDNDAGAIEGYSQPITFTGNAVKAISLFVKQGSSVSSLVQLLDTTAPAARLFVVITWSGGLPVVTATTGTVLGYETLTDGVFRILMSTTSVTAANTHTLSIFPAWDASTTVAATGTVYASGVQAEDRETPSAYIPTTTTHAIGGDWNAFDIVALDAAAPQELGYFTDRGDQVMCASVLDQILGSVHAFWSTDVDGIIRIRQLEAPETNFVAQPSSIATAPWAVEGGTPVATNNVASYQGHSFSRITAADTGAIRQLLAFVEDGVYFVRLLVKSNGAAGTALVFLHDETAVANRISATLTVASDGSISVTAVAAGSHVRTISLGAGVYSVLFRGSGVVAANDNYVYAPGSGTATSILMSDIRVFPDDPDVSLPQSSMEGMEEIASSDENGGLPCSKAVVRYAPNYATLSGAELAADVSAESRALFEKDWLSVETAENADVIAAHALAKPRIVETLLVDEADAAAEAATLRTLFGVERRWHRVPMRIDSTLFRTLLGAKADVSSDRYSMGAGKRALVLEASPDVGAGAINFSVWG